MWRTSFEDLGNWPFQDSPVHNNMSYWKTQDISTSVHQGSLADGVEMAGHLEGRDMPPLDGRRWNR